MISSGALSESRQRQVNGEQCVSCSKFRAGKRPTLELWRKTGGWEGTLSKHKSTTKAAPPTTTTNPHQKPSLCQHRSEKRRSCGGLAGEVGVIDNLLAGWLAVYSLLSTAQYNGAHSDALTNIPQPTWWTLPRFRCLINESHTVWSRSLLLKKKKGKEKKNNFLLGTFQFLLIQPTSGGEEWN